MVSQQLAMDPEEEHTTTPPLQIHDQLTPTPGAMEPLLSDPDSVSFCGTSKTDGSKPALYPPPLLGPPGQRSGRGLNNRP